MQTIPFLCNVLPFLSKGKLDKIVLYFKMPKTKTFISEREALDENLSHSELRMGLIL
jgi:hypothetical protein